MRRLLAITMMLGVFLSLSYSSGRTHTESGVGAYTVHLPSIFSGPALQGPRVNAPFFGTAVQINEAAIFWFGKVTLTENYTDVRVGYTNDFLYVRLAIFDRQIWYDTSPSESDLTSWDAAGLYLNLDGNTGDAPGPNSYAFVGQLSWNEPRDDYQAAYRGASGGWQLTATVPFTSTAGWRSDNSGINDDAKPDRGWSLTYAIPFESLGLSGPPAPGTVWGMGVILYDRDDMAGTTAIPDQIWPPTFSPNVPSSWGQLSFGLLPAYQPPAVTPAGSTTIRHNLNGNTVVDGMVGGEFNCGSQSNWQTWGEANYAGATQINIQNQQDIADWPCFSKYYVTFPLDSVPAGTAIISATLTMYHFSGSGQNSEPPAPASLIQVLTVADDWDEATLTWNNAPLALENVSQAWVEPLYNGGAGVPIVWDVSAAVAAAHAAGEPLRLALYSADAGQHSGKYFHSSDAGDWNAAGRPTLEVIWGQP